MRGRSNDAVSAAAPFAVLAVVRELARRGTLASAVGGQTDYGLTRLLRFIRRYGWRPSATPTCLHLFRVVTSEFDKLILPKIFIICSKCYCN